MKQTLLCILSVALVACLAGACADNETREPFASTGGGADGGTDAGTDARTGVGDDAGSDISGDVFGDISGDVSGDTSADARGDARTHDADDARGDGGDPGADTGADIDADPDAAPSERPVSIDATWCAMVDCGDGGECDPTTGTCACAAPTWFDGDTCAEPIGCEDDAACAELCPIPLGPTLGVVSAGETLHFVAGDWPIETGTTRDPAASEPDVWVPGAEVVLAHFEGSVVRVFARVASDTCAPGGTFNAAFAVRERYPANPGEPDSDALARDDATIVGWATSVVNYAPGAELDEEWTDPNRALGPAEGTTSDVVSLGEGGALILGFDPPIRDGRGSDFAVFENGFADDYIELAFVEVSSDGVTFVRFDSASTGEVPRGAYGYTDTTTFGQVAGKYRRGFGTPFDLAALRQRPEVSGGSLDLGRITHVRIVDIVGDGSTLDRFGRPIFDPFPTWGPAGFDVDAVGVVNAAEAP